MTTFNPPRKILDTITTIRADAAIAKLNAVRAEARRAELYIKARSAIADCLIAHEITAERAYGAATDVLGEHLIELIDQGH